MIREYFRQTPVYPFYCRAREYYRFRQVLRDWERSGRPVPPPHEFKRETVKRYARRFGLEVLVETGTFHGHMIEGALRHFREIYSVELSADLHRAACNSFGRYKHVHLLLGDSSFVLRDLLPSLNGKPLIWLDAHYCGDGTARGGSDTPIVQELQAILAQKQIEPVVLIDDARLFDGTHGYPTLAGIREMIVGLRSDWLVDVQDDIIRAHTLA